jgi:hypothetical protein
LMLAKYHHHGDDPHASTTGLPFDTSDATSTPGDVGHDDFIRVFNPDAIVDSKTIAQWTELVAMGAASTSG